MWIFFQIRRWPTNTFIRCSEGQPSKTIEFSVFRILCLLSRRVVSKSTSIFCKNRSDFLSHNQHSYQDIWALKYLSRYLILLTVNDICDWNSIPCYFLDANEDNKSLYNTLIYPQKQYIFVNFSLDMLLYTCTKK